VQWGASGRGDLYAVYPHDNPRRTAHFRQDGTFVQDFPGDTTYDGGGGSHRPGGRGYPHPRHAGCGQAERRARVLGHRRVA
jgi:hypothetical protein